MHGLKHILEDAELLPLEERALLVDTLLRNFQPVDPAIEKSWYQVAQARLSDLRSGKTKSVSGDKAFEDIRLRLGK